MRFIMVNGRTPRPRCLCVMCGQPIELSYLREIGTDLTYCGHGCYAEHCTSALLLLENRATARLPSVRHAHAGIADASC
jgi:hypothetical protein